MNKTKLTFVLLMLCTSMMAQVNKDTTDLGEYVVTDTRFETPIEKSGKVIYKITADDITKLAGRTVANLLNTLPGVNIDGAFGTPGTNLSYSLRGGRNRHTLILIDGLPINDPSSIANDYDLRLINARDIEFIELLKGAASTLYGTNAASGVINIKLKTPKAETPEMTFSQEVGSWKTMNTNADVQGKTGKLSYLAGASFSVSDGISAAQSADPAVEFANDGFFRYTGRTRLNYAFSDDFTLGGNLSYENFNSDFDGGAFFDADNEFDIRQVRFGLNPKLKYDHGSLELKFNYNRIKREFISAFPLTSRGYNTQADLVNQYVIGDNVKTTLGVQIQGFSFVEGDEEPSQSNVDPYLNVFWDATESLTLNVGARLNNNSEYGSNFVYSFNPSYLIQLGNENKLKVFGTYSTAFVAPSLFQLFSSLYGNTDLGAEEIEGYELGLSLYLSDKLTINGEYFDRKETNAIDFVSLFDGGGNFIGGEYQNVSGIREIDGVELDLTYQPTESFTLTAHYTDYKFGDRTQFYRIPDLKYGVSAQYTLRENTSFGLIYNYFGERQTAIFSDPFFVDLGGYNLVDFTISHQLFDGDLVLNGAINNLFDESFIGVYGFNSRPSNFMLGVTAKF